jgi:GNAT superfamily N-acetyltransferase
MIKRISNPVEFEKLIDDMYELFKQHDSTEGHALLAHNPATIKANFAHPSILAWDFLAWGNLKDGKFDAMIAFQKVRCPKFNEEIIHEFLWLSKNPTAGYKLFKTAVEAARKMGCKYVAMSTAVNNPSHEKVKSFYKKMGFLKDTETYISKL